MIVLLSRFTTALNVLSTDKCEIVNSFPVFSTTGDEFGIAFTTKIKSTLTHYYIDDVDVLLMNMDNYFEVLKEANPKYTNLEYLASVAVEHSLKPYILVNQVEPSYE